MKTLNVLINPRLNQFRILPSCLEINGKLINITFGELGAGDGVSRNGFNHDLFITYSEGMRPDAYCPIMKTLYLSWQSKVTQTNFIKAVSGHKLFTTAFSGKDPLYYLPPGGLSSVVIKPADSSRSMNLMIFRKPNFAIRQFTQDLCHILRKRKAEEKGNYTVLLQPEVKALVEAYGGEYVLGSPRANDCENALWEGGQFIIQEYNQYVDNADGYLELRVLSDGKDVSFFSRDHRECVGVVSKNVFTQKFTFGDSVNEREIADACLALVPNHGSLDLWVVYSDHKLITYGFYEYQPQFALNHLTPTDALTFMETAIDNLVTRYGLAVGIQGIDEVSQDILSLS